MRKLLPRDWVTGAVQIVGKLETKGWRSHSGFSEGGEVLREKIVGGVGMDDQHCLVAATPLRGCFIAFSDADIVSLRYKTRVCCQYFG